MAIAATIGAAAIGGGAAIYSANKGASAAQKGADQATQTQLGIYNQTRGDLAPYNQGGQTATNALMVALGLAGPNAINLSGGGPVNRLTGGGSTIDMTPDANGTYSMSGGGASGPDWGAYMQANPDVASAYQNYLGQGLKAGHAHLTPDQFAQQHYQTYGQAEGRALPGGSQQGPAAGGAGGDGTDGAPGTNPITGGANLLTGYSGQAPTYTPYSESPGGQSAPVYSDFNPTITDLENTPGYKFALDQGLKATQSGYAARGLGASGAAMKGAADYAEGLAGTTLKQNFDIANQNYGNKVLGYSTGLSGHTTDFNNLLSQFNTGFGAYNTTQSNLYNRLFGLSGLGEGAAAQTGGFGVQTGGNVGNNITGAATASAAASVAGGNNISSIASSIPNAFLSNKLLSMYGPQGGMYGSSAGSGRYAGATDLYNRG